MQNKNKIIIVSGPSGVGKKTVLTPLMQDKKLLLKYSISLTTRSKRPNETNGVDYYFTTKEEFQKAIKQQRMLEWANFHDCYYGTLKQEVYNKLQQHYNVVLEIETIGAAYLLNTLSKATYLSIFIIPKHFDQLKQRLFKRQTETKQEIKQRLQKAKQELLCQDLYDYVVVNDNLAKAQTQIKEIIIANTKTLY